MISGKVTIVRSLAAMGLSFCSGRRVLGLLVVFLFLSLAVFVTPAQAQQCKDWPQGQCGDRCGNFGNCSGPRPGSAGCIDHHSWVGGTCGCQYTGSSWDLNTDICPGGPGDSEEVNIEGQVMGCQGPLAGVTVNMVRKDMFADTWQYPPSKTAVTDANGNYSMGTGFQDDRIFRIEVQDTRTFVGTGSDACTAGGRPRHSWCQHNTMKGTTKDLNFQQTGCVQDPPQCVAITANGQGLNGGNKIVSENEKITLNFTGKGSSIQKMQICFHAAALASPSQWNADWHCVNPTPTATNPYSVSYSFAEIRSMLSSRFSANGYNDAYINLVGITYAGNVHSPLETFCDGGGVWRNNQTAQWPSSSCSIDINKPCTGKLSLAVPLTKSCTITSPGPANILATQSKTFNVTGSSSRSTSEPTRLVISKSNFSKMANPPSGTKEAEAGGRYYYIFQSQIASLTNNSFESGNTNGWAGSAGTLSEFWAVDGNQYPSATNGRYYLKVVRGADGDAFVVSNWIETHGDVSGQRFTLSFSAKSHIENATINKIKNIFLQRCSSEACSSADSWDTNASFGDIDLSGAWKSFNRDVIFPYPSDGNATTKIRLVLRLPDTKNVPIYYDNISLTRASGNFFNCSTSSSTNCTASATVSSLPIGTYNAHCDLPTEPNKCSGNPACSYEGCSGQAYCTDCGATGWASCSNSDNLSFVVQPTCSDTNPSPVSLEIASIAGANEYDRVPLPLNNEANPTLVNMRTTSSQVKFYWNHPVSSVNKKYELLLYRKGAFNNSISEAYAAAGTDNRVTLYTISAPAGSSAFKLHVPSSQQNYQLVVAIRAINDDTCSGTDVYSGWNRSYFNLVSEVKGNFKLTTTNACFGGSTLATPQGKVKDTRTSNATSVIIPSSIGKDVSGSSYMIDKVPYSPSSSWGHNNIRLKLENSDPTTAYMCASCNNSVSADGFNCIATKPYPNVDLKSPGVEYDFYLSQVSLISDPWWQVVNGLAYAGGAMSSNVPDNCGSVTDPLCIKSLATKSLGSSDDRTSGLPLTGSGIIVSGAGTFSQNGDSRSTGLEFDAINNAPEDYEYFANKVSLSGNALPATIDSKTDLTGASTGSTDPTDSTKIHHFTGTLTINPGATTISIAPTEKFLIFVDGDLVINGNPESKIIEVAEGGYLGFIVKGKITFTKNIGYTITDANKSSNLPPNVSGVFVANQIIVDSDGPDVTQQDLKFVGEGTYVGWNSGEGIILRRNFTSTNLGKRFHNGDPTELFIYRPSYLENTPNVLKSSGMVWQEVN